MDDGTIVTALLAFVVPFVIGGTVGFIAGSAHVDRMVEGLMSLKASIDWHMQNIAAMARLRKIQWAAVFLGTVVGILSASLVLIYNWSALPR